MNPSRRSSPGSGLRLAAHVAALSPAAYLALRTATDLGANPIETITRITGRTALLLLLGTLACTPAVTLGARRAGTIRRTLGLYAFAWALVHLAVFAGLDYGLDLSLIRDDALVEKPYIVVGLGALLVMLPLAATSTSGWQRRLGRDWKRLHRLVYVAGALAAVHYLWLVKSVTAGPALAAIGATVLLAARLPAVRRRVASLRPGAAARGTSAEGEGAGST